MRHRNDMGLELGIPTWDDNRLVAAWLHTTWVQWFNGFLSCSFSYHMSIILLPKMPLGVSSADGVVSV